MIYAALVANLIYCYIFFRYFQKLMPAQGAVSPLNMYLSLAGVGAAYLFLNPGGSYWLTMPAMMFTLAIGLRFSTAANWSQAFYCACLCVLSAYCVRGICAGITALAIPRYNFVADEDAYYVSALLAVPFTLALMTLLRKTILPDSKLITFLHSRAQLNMAVAYDAAAMINLTLLNWGRGLSPHPLWYPAIGLAACVLTLSMLIYVTHESIRGAELMKYQWRHKIMEEEFERQLRHYKSYQKYTESFQAFKHDYKSMMASAKTLLRVQENDQAIQLIDEVYEEMQKRVYIHKKYSDNVVLDAILQDMANVCVEKEIRFSFQAAAPRNTGLTTLDAIRIFSNITSNAVEACEKVPAPERFIDIVSGNDQQWASIHVLNAYDGKAREQNNGHYLTTKPERDGHGLGLGIVKEIAERLGGFILCEADAESKTFSTRVLIPQTGPADKPD